MAKKMKKFGAFLLVFAMSVIMLITSAFASETAVCKIVETGVEYETLTEAVTAANDMDSATIEMLKDIDFEGTKLEIKKDITIIGAYTISRGSYTGTMFNVPAGGSLTLDGGIVFDGSNNWTFNKALYEANLYGQVSGTAWADYVTAEEGGTKAVAPMFVVNGTMIANEATVQNSYSDKGNGNSGEYAIIRVNSGATLTTNGATFIHITANSASTIVGLNSATWNIMGDTLIAENYSGRNGGICRNNNSVINMSGGSVKDNYGHNTNGTFAMMYGNGSALYMTGGEICHNSSIGGGDNGRCPAVYLHTAAYVKITGGSICHNIGGTRGGIDSYKTSSVLDINRADQEFDNTEWAESGAAAYAAGNHPVIADNISLGGSKQNDVGNTYSIEEYDWWITGGIYTQDVDDFCAEGYICIPYADTEREDDYIVVPGYRVKYYAVEKVESEKDIIDEAGEVIGTEPVVEYNTTLVHKYFHMLPRDKFWYEMDERANNFELTVEGGEISEWYTEKELENLYDFEGTKLESDLNLYGEVVEIEEIPDEDVPLGPTPGGNENIEDEQPPLADVPKTGSMMMAAMSVMATSGAAAVLFRKKKED